VIPADEKGDISIPRDALYFACLILCRELHETCSKLWHWLNECLFTQSAGAKFQYVYMIISVHDEHDGGITSSLCTGY